MELNDALQGMCFMSDFYPLVQLQVIISLLPYRNKSTLNEFISDTQDTGNRMTIGLMTLMEWTIPFDILLINRNKPCLRSSECKLDLGLKKSFWSYIQYIIQEYSYSSVKQSLYRLACHENTKLSMTLPYRLDLVIGLSGYKSGKRQTCR